MITGGQSLNQFDRGTVGSAELYDPTTGTFTATGPMVAARLYHTAVLLGSGKVLIISGAEWQSRDTTIDLRAELYDPTNGIFAATGTPASINPPQGDEFIQPMATVLQDGRVLVTWTSTLAELYDPRAGTFSPTGRMIGSRTYQGAPRPCLPTARSWLPVALLTGQSTALKCTTLDWNLQADWQDDNSSIPPHGHSSS